MGVFAISLGDMGIFPLDYVKHFKSSVANGLGTALQRGMFAGLELEALENCKKDGGFTLRAVRVIKEGFGDPAIIFVVTDFRSARTEGTKNFIGTIRETAGKEENAFVYHIILDMLGEFQQMKHGFYGFRGGKMGSEAEALQLGALPCLCNCEQITYTMGFRRLADLIGRIIGSDIPEETFPNYDRDMLCRISWHINRENFNEGKPRIAAIPKYQFGEDGKPVITNEMLSQFQMNWKQWEANCPEIVVKEEYVCPHCQRQMTNHCSWWSSERRIIKCHLCGNLCNASKTGLK